MKPWCIGVLELLKHAIDHLEGENDFDRRIAFISVDNAVEITINTFLSLPKSVSNQDTPSRKELQESELSFPKQLELLRKYATNKLLGFDLSVIEWYHKLRNQLYHKGSGLTVDKSMVETYYVMAQNLFEQLFDEILPPEQNFSYRSSLRLFLRNWQKFKRDFRLKLPPKDTLAYYWKRDYLNNIDESLVPIFNRVTDFQDNIVLGKNTPSNEEFAEIEKLINILETKVLK